MIAAITGHQNLGNNEGWVRDALRDVIGEYSITRGVTSLAAGADQLFAWTLREAGLPFVVVVPSRNYAQAFHDRASLQDYWRLRELAIDVVELPFDQPTPPAFLAGGRAVVDYGTVVLAVWDGKPAKDVGGTAQIVQYARDKGKCVIHLDVMSRTIRPVGICP